MRGKSLANWLPRRAAGPAWIFPLIIGAITMAAPWLGLPPTWIRQVILISILSLVVAGLNLTFGFAGEFILGQVALFAAGAYVAGILAVHGWDATLTIPAAGIVAALLGLVTALAGLRLGGWGLAMSSFFLVILVPDVVQLFQGQTGGLVGLLGIPVPKLLGQPLTNRGYYLLVTGVLLVVIAIFRNYVLSPHGSALRVLRESPVLAASVGLDVYRVKVVVCVLGAIPAGLAGGLYAYLDQYITPSYFDLTLAITFIAASVLGGSESIYGAIAGSAILQLGPMQVTAFQSYALIAYGALLVVGGVAFSGGIAGLLRRAMRAGAQRLGFQASGEAVQFEDAPSIVEAVDDAGRSSLDPIPGETLIVDKAVKEFAGLRALAGVSITAKPGQVTSLVGANGSGKTTLLNLVSGFYRPSAGSIVLGGTRLDELSASGISRRGVGRTFQTPIVPRGLSTLEAVASARYHDSYVGTLPTVLRLPRFRKKQRADVHAAREALGVVGLSHAQHLPAQSLALGSRRLLEVARALAADPRLLLLDEPASGLDVHEVAALARIIRRLADAGVTVLLVEHNFRLVCDVSDKIYVLEFGNVLAEGTSMEIQRDERVQRSYLGTSDQVSLDPIREPE